MNTPHKVFAMSFASVYPLYVTKVERKGRSSEELDQVICWLTGYDAAALAAQIAQAVSIERFFAEAPAMNPGTALITGTICGIRVETIADPLMQKIRWLDKLVDELAKGRPLAKILRQ